MTFNDSKDVALVAQLVEQRAFNPKRAGSNPAEGIKSCVICKKEKHIDEFNKRLKAKDGLQDSCRQCSRNWYQANKEKHKKNVGKRRKQYRKSVKEFIWNYKLQNPCVDCNEPDPVVLDFDHINDDKEFSVANGAVRGFSIEKIKKEIEKCEVVCANCHRRRTHKRVRVPDDPLKTTTKED